MRSGVIVLPEPVVDDDLGLLGRCAPLRIENLSTQCPVESRIAAVLLGWSWIDADRLNANASKPDLHSFSSELWSIIGSYVLWGAVPQEQRIKRFQNIVSAPILVPTVTAKACRVYSSSTVNIL